MSAYSASLSSKNQITIPVDILKKLGWAGGQKVSLAIEKNAIVIRNFREILGDISKITKKYNLPSSSVEEAIITTRKQSNKNRYSYED